MPKGIVSKLVIQVEKSTSLIVEIVTLMSSTACDTGIRFIAASRLSCSFSMRCCPICPDMKIKNGHQRYLIKTRMTT